MDNQRDLKNWGYNIGLGLVYMGVIITLAYFSLDFYTRHDSKIQVPNLVKLNPIEAEEKLSSLGLRMVINDTVYLETFKPGVVTEQLPESSEFVKEGRTIYITVNASTRPKVSMPKLVDCSLNLAKALIKNAGLTLGEISYSYGEMGHNLVVSQKIGGISIEPGQKILKGTKVDLVVIDDQKAAPSDTLVVDESENIE
jgi:beta-lactam-binding protein with PASTA domain